ncbi:MAG: radical SAM protein, partial [Bdellovibrionales bacterium]|nr:radical SAM protein [Bdellovibrionales bacterium]
MVLETRPVNLQSEALVTIPVRSSEITISEDALLADFFSMDREELAQHLHDTLGLKTYRADQIFQWVYQKRVTDPMQMTNIGMRDRERLSSVLSFHRPEPAKVQQSQDGTRKYLFSVSHNDLVESVMIKQPTRMTLCVSSQVGCALGCRFCQTGTMGLKRHLSTAEILQQVMGVVIDSAENHNDAFTNMVFMGMGEPLHN